LKQFDETIDSLNMDPGHHYFANSIIS